MPTPPPASAPAPANRLSSLDAYRGFVMFLMMAEVLNIKYAAKSFPDNDVWKQLAFHTSHVDWAGCSLHDLIQPSFSFLVGVALPFSIASRKAKGQKFGWMLCHAIWRAVLLVCLGIFLRSIGHAQTRVTFEDTLSQIGLGYVFLFLLGFVRIRWQVLALVLILVGCWGAFASYKLPPPDFDYKSVGVEEQWIEKNPLYTGLAAHWNKNTNLSWNFDQVIPMPGTNGEVKGFLRLFPHDEKVVMNRGGYATLSFIPTLATMILGLIAGEWLKIDVVKWKKVLWLAGAGLVALAAGYLLDKYGICPSVKRIWTPAWVLFSGGWCFLLLAGFYGIIDGLGWRAWSFPLLVIGMNSIAIYFLFDSGLRESVRTALYTHVGERAFKAFNSPGVDLEKLVSGGAILIIFWLILYWMYRNKIFVRI